MFSSSMLMFRSAYPDIFSRLHEKLHAFILDLLTIYENSLKLVSVECINRTTWGKWKVTGLQLTESARDLLENTT